MIHNRPVLKARRQELRNQATPAEKLLWRELRCRQLAGWKFRRQHSVGPYVLDFYCPSVRLAVELDGDSHFNDDAIAYDRERTAYLNGQRISVLRFLNTEVYTDVTTVCARIAAEIEDLTTPGPS